MAELISATNRRVAVELTEKILDDCIPASFLSAEVAALIKILQAFRDEYPVLMDDVNACKAGTETVNGLALAPDMAATCADDAVRTIMFLRGTRAAIADQYAQRSARPVRILYAGCGPYAILAVPLMLVLSAEEASFSLIDIHPESVASAERIITALNLPHFVSDTKVADAAEYQADPDFPADIILTEVMQACLQAEPQVAVSRCLLSQAPAAVLIPQEIRIGLVFTDPAIEFSAAQRSDSERIYAGPVFILNREHIVLWTKITGNYLPGYSVKVVADLNQQHALLFTTICVYQDYRLGPYDSGLTCPRILDTQEPIHGGDTLHFHYRLGAYPELCIRAVPDESPAGRV